MVIKMRIKFWLSQTVIISVFGFHSLSVRSAPGELSEIPLFLGNQVKPNVLFVLDDSGSMDNEVLLRRSAQDILGGNSKSGTGATSGNLDMDPSSTDLTEFREHCLGYNLTAFDPFKTYTPWLGYNDIDVSVANPQAPAFAMGFNRADNTGTTYYSSGGGNGGDNPEGRATLNLNQTDVGYLPWNDADMDGEYDAGECNDTSTATASAAFVAFPDMTEEMQQNYANWYTYYRKRRFVLIKPMLDILDSYDIRAALASINAMSDSGFAMADLEEGTNRDDAKDVLLNLGGSRVFTPLRRPLINAGRYYSGQSVDSGFVGVGTTPADPILPAADGGACQANYTMLMTDGFSFENDDFGFNNRLPESSDLATIGNADGDNNSDFDGGDFGDIYSGTLGDIAMHYYEGDLRPDDVSFPDSVVSNNPLDTNTAQHMVTYTVAFGVEGNLSGFPDAGASNWPVANNVNFWDSQNVASLDDLLHAAFNGRGLHLSALNSDELEAGLNSVLASIISATEGSAASVGFNSTNISNGTILYQSRFFSNHWSGTIEAFDFSSGTVGTQIFDAGEQLVTRIADPLLGHTDRNIITYNGTTGVPFRFPADHLNIDATTEISQDQVDDLLADSDGSDDQTYGENIVAFLRGDSTSADGIVFRDRGNFLDDSDNILGENVLGDIAHSSPQVVTVPDEVYPNSIEATPYSTFVTTNESRIPMVYVGANDGMLHAFYAETAGGNAAGDEAFAYIPSILFSDDAGQGLHYLADVDYSHLPYVDATPTPGDVFIDGAWRTYLVGGLGRGGRGIYVLDITNPNNFSEANADDIVVKEFTHNDLGYTFSRPQIAKLNDGRWAAVFGNGYAQDSGDGRAKLFILYLDNASPEYRVIDTGQGSIASSDCLNAGSDCNGLSSPTLIDITRDAVLDRVYAGDLHGNMWVFDLSSDDVSDWGVAHRDTSDNPVPLFTACSGTPCTSSNRQPITAEPVVTGHATESARVTAPNAFVLFGTGQYVTESDISDTSDQTFYGVWDAGSANGEVDRSDLTEQTISTSGGFRTLSDNDVSYSTGIGGNFGWFIDLPEAGERSVITPILAGEVILFATSIPNDAACASGGSGYLMAADIFQGSVTNFDVFENTGQMGVQLTNLPVGTTFIDDTSVIPDSTGDITPVDTNVGQSAQSRRFNWSIIR